MTRTRRAPRRGGKPFGAAIEANAGRRAPAPPPLAEGPFYEMGIDAQVCANLPPLGMTEPTPIQREAIPAIVSGRDLLGLAQTGTGKTAAFGLPMIERLLKAGGRPAPKTVRALILAPTRELATQITASVDSYAQGTPVRAYRVVGGASLNAQAERLSRGVDVLVATPGRLIDLIDRGAVDLSQTSYLVLDEADQMLDIGFIHALRRIARVLPKNRQTLLFSATMPKLMEELADSYLTDPVRVAVNPPGKAAEKIAQGVHFVNQGDKAALLAEYVAKHPGELAIVFGRTKHGSDKLSKLMEKWGFSVAAIHGNKSQGQRERALSAFRAGQTQVLVATDVAARGLDIPEVAHVYNYDLPNVPENYVHRIGRTARAGRDGRAVAFCAPDEWSALKDIERAMKAEIPVIGGEPPARPEPPRRNGGGNKPQQRNRPAGRPSRAPKSAQRARG
ncbi:DEAD/DEAH box helicase [Paracoccus sp. S-4012]|nr:DEAD/DEAH box helicase [Paracoccus sp. S-4012]